MAQWYRMQVISFVLAILTSLSARAADVIALSTTEFPPYMSAIMPSGGLAVEIAIEAFKRSGYPVKVDYQPWVRALDNAKKGKVTGMVGIWKNKEREQWFVFSNPMFSNQIGFFKRVKDTIRYKDLHDLKPYTIGIVRGYANPQAFVNAKLNTNMANDDSSNLLKLAAGRINLVLIERGLANYLIVNRLTQLTHRVEWIEPATGEFPMYIAISKQSPDAVKKIEAFNQGLHAMKSDGTLRKMLQEAKIRLP